MSFSITSLGIKAPKIASLIKLNPNKWRIAQSTGSKGLCAGLEDGFKLISASKQIQPRVNYRILFGGKNR